MEIFKVAATEPVFGTYIGVVNIEVHDKGMCYGEFCCIHNPSDHHMKNWPQLWRDDRKMMERTCPHGIGHPDPDDRSSDRIHGCCGCCVPPEVPSESE